MSFYITIMVSNNFYNFISNSVVLFIFKFKFKEEIFYYLDENSK